MVGWCFVFIWPCLVKVVDHGIDSKDHSKSLILIKHYETESTEPIKFKTSSPKLELRKLNQNFKRKELKQLKKKFIKENPSIKIGELLSKSRPKSVESYGTPEKQARITNFHNPSLQTIMTTNEEPRFEKLLKWVSLLILYLNFVVALKVINF